MRRPLVAGVGVALVLAAMPLAARAVGSPEVTLRTPAADQVVVGDMSIGWTYKGFSPSAWVDVEARRGDEPFERIARVRIDDGTPGYAGSTTWSTTADDDGADYTIRLVVPSNKRVRSSASPVVVDNTAPVATEVERTPANDAGWNNDDVTVRWACTDAASGVVASEAVATVGGEGTDLTASGTCTDNAGHSTTATATGIDIDRTLPSATFTDAASADGLPRTSVLIGVGGSASDALAGVAEVTVGFVNAAGTEAVRKASCACGSSLAAWGVSTVGLAPGMYEVTARATDLAGNTGASATVEYLVVAAPEPPTVEPPPVTPPPVEPPPVEPPPVEPPPVTPPPVEPPPVEQPPVTVPTIPPVTVPST